MNNLDEILRQIDDQVDMLLSTRAVFPHVPKEFIGEKTYETSPFYQQHGHHIVFNFSQPLTEEQIDKFSAIGLWINQNFLIRLCAILEYYEVIPPKGKGVIDAKLEGHEHIDILRRLRNNLAHTSGRYNADESEERKLLERIMKTYPIDNEGEAVRVYPVPIHTLLIPIAHGCKRYAQALYENESN